MTDSATFNVGDKQVELPYVAATQGNNGHDITKLLAQTGDTTYDQGFSSTAACKSEITFIDGDAGAEHPRWAHRNLNRLGRQAREYEGLP